MAALLRQVTDRLTDDQPRRGKEFLAHTALASELGAEVLARVGRSLDYCP